jgi:hypothetical protein
MFIRRLLCHWSFMIAPDGNGRKGFVRGKSASLRGDRTEERSVDRYCPPERRRVPPPTAIRAAELTASLIES